MPEVGKRSIRYIERDINEIAGMRPDVPFIYVNLIPECELVAISDVALEIDGLAERQSGLSNKNNARRRLVERSTESRNLSRTQITSKIATQKEQEPPKESTYFTNSRGLIKRSVIPPRGYSAGGQRSSVNKSKRQVVAAIKSNMQRNSKSSIVNSISETQMTNIVIPNSNLSHHAMPPLPVNNSQS